MNLNFRKNPKFSHTSRETLEYLNNKGLRQDRLISGRTGNFLNRSNLFWAPSSRDVYRVTRKNVGKLFEDSRSG